MSGEGRRVRLAAPEDAAAMAAIYAPYVRTSVATFEYDPPDEAEMAARMAAAEGQLPWLVFEADGRVAGYAYAGRLGQRRGYDWSATASVYIEQGRRRTGAGRALYAALERLITAQGYRTLYALIAVPNSDSEAFHLRLGYERQGLLPHAGYKFGRPVGVAYYAKTLLPVTENPPLPRPFSALLPAQVQAALVPKVSTE